MAVLRGPAVEGCIFLRSCFGAVRQMKETTDGDNLSSLDSPLTFSPLFFQQLSNHLGYPIFRAQFSPCKVLPSTYYLTQKVRQDFVWVYLILLLVNNGASPICYILTEISTQIVIVDREKTDPQTLSLDTLLLYYLLI